MYAQFRYGSTMIARAPVLAAALLCALSGPLGASGSLHCAMRREISPCTCRREEAGSGAIHVVCQRINNYEEIAKALTNKFSPMTKIGLDISYSQLPDFSTHSLRELGLKITRLKLNFDNLSALEESVFSELDLVDYFSIADNSLTELPRNVLKNLPHMRTLDLCRNKITQLTNDDYQVIQNVEHLLVADNEISNIEKNALPKSLKHIHLGLNNLSSLNGTLRDLDSLEWIFINTNNLKCIENELPINAKKIVFIHAAQNKLQSLPKDFRQMPSLESLYFYDNNLKSLDGTLQKSKKLKRIGLSFNKIESLAEDEFLETEALAELDIAFNHLKSLNGSLRKLRALRYLNLTNNMLPEFSFQEIKGLQRLSVIDLSHNKITFLSGNMENLVDVETRVLELRLDHNYLHNIGGAMMGLHGLLRLNLSHNSIQHITPDDFIGLDELRLLDISHNEISTLEETSKTFLPELEELLVHHNNITALDKVFHGLPSLCAADLSHNQIKNINYNFVSKTRCTINGVPSLLKIFLQENPVLCSDRIYELVSVLESFNARISGVATCVRERAPPEDSLALGDGNRFKPVLIMSAQGLPMEDEVCTPDQPSNPFDYHNHHHHHLGPPMKQETLGPLDNAEVLPPSSNNFLKWPKEQRRPNFAQEQPLPRTDHVQLRLVGGGYVAQ